jgi:hypothetical protein
MLYAFPSPRLKSLNLNAAIFSWSARTARIPFERYVVTNSYSKSFATLTWFTVLLSGGIYVGNMLGIIFTVAKSFTSLDHLSEGGRYGLARAVEGEAGSALMDDSCTLVDTPLSDMTLSIIKSIRIS